MRLRLIHCFQFRSTAVVVIGVGVGVRVVVVGTGTNQEMFFRYIHAATGVEIVDSANSQ